MEETCRLIMMGIHPVRLLQDIKVLYSLNLTMNMSLKKRFRLIKRKNGIVCFYLKGICCPICIGI